MKKNSLWLVYGLLVSVFLVGAMFSVSTNAIAQGDGVSYTQLEAVGDRVEKYLVMDVTYLYFDYDAAKKIMNLKKLLIKDYY